jgi:hypothetical protein
LIFDHQEGKTVFSEYSDFGYRGGLKRRSGYKKKSIEVVYSKSYHKGIKAIEDVTWSDIEANTAIESGVCVDIQKLLDMTDFIIDHTYVQHNNSIYRQRMGIAMDMNNSPQMAHLYCAIYETEFMLRAASIYYAKPKDKRSNFDQARLACIFNTMRYIDDINSPSSLKVVTSRNY